MSTPNQSSTQPMFEAMVNLFKEENWHYAEIEEQCALSLTFQGKNGTWDCYAQAKEEEEQFIFYSLCPSQVPKPKRRAVGEFLSRANYGMIIGNFELDFDDGEIRYKTSMGVKNNSLDSATIKELVYTNLMMMERYLPGITSVISGKLSPIEAIRPIRQIEILPQPFSSDPSNNLTAHQPLGITGQTKKGKLNSSPSTESPPVSPKNTTESDIFSRLTKEEILKFDEVLQLTINREKPRAQTLLEQLKTGLKIRLGEVGGEIFEKTYKMFQTYQFDAKQIRFIRRYSELYDLIELQIEQIFTQTSPDENIRGTLNKWEKMRESTKERLQQIAKNQIYPQQEIDMLVEIEEIRKELAVAKKK